MEEASWRKHLGGGIMEEASWGDPEGIWGHPGGVWGDAQAAQAQEGLPGGSEGAGLIKVVPLSVNLHFSAKNTNFTVCF